MTRSYQGYKLLCEIRGRNNKSVCEEADDSRLAKVVKNIYLDPPSSKPYAFRSNPPNLDGQIGVPSIVDRILGKLLLKNFYYFSNFIHLQHVVTKSKWAISQATKGRIRQ